jgi:pimeloyl-ACP methyl ester carboxylesterase
MSEKERGGSMQKHTFPRVAAVAVVAMSIAGPRSDAIAQRALNPARATGAGRYASVNGLNMYHEVHGTGRPLVLLHGAFSNINTDFGTILPRFARTRRVIAVELQAHGRTSDIARPLTYEQMADDVAELLRQLEVKSADVFGYSMGGGVAMLLAARHPAVVGKVVFMGGAAYNPEGFQPGLLEGQAALKPEHLAGTPWLKEYQRIAPKPANFPALVEKIKQLDLNWKGWPAETLESIKSPVMIIVGDADVTRLEHVVQMFRLFGGGVAGDLVGVPNAQLAVLPGTTHVTIVGKTDWLYSMANAFYEAPPPKAKGAN